MNRILRLVLVGLIVLSVSDQGEAQNRDLDERTTESVNRGVKWLKNRQRSNGAWSSRRHAESPAMTALSLMAIRSATLNAKPDVPKEIPQYQRRALRWLLSTQKESGLFNTEAIHGPLYEHAVVTWAVAKTVPSLDGDLKDECLKKLRIAVDLLLKAQRVNKSEEHRGGWRYKPDSIDSDLPVTAWVVLALNAANEAGVKVPDETFKQAASYVLRCAAQSSFKYQAGSETGAVVIRSGLGITALELCGVKRAKESKRAVPGLLERWHKPASYRNYWLYHGTYFMCLGTHLMGQDEWKQVKPVLHKMLIERQQEDGTWPPAGGEGPYGPEYTASLAVLSLTVDWPANKRDKD